MMELLDESALEAIVFLVVDVCLRQSSLLMLLGFA